MVTRPERWPCYHSDIKTEYVVCCYVLSAAMSFVTFQRGLSGLFISDLLVWGFHRLTSTGWALGCDSVQTQRAGRRAALTGRDLPGCWVRSLHTAGWTAMICSFIHKFFKPKSVCTVQWYPAISARGGPFSFQNNTPESFNKVDVI